MVQETPVLVITDLNFPSDDLQALLLLLHSAEVQIVGIVAETGNTWGEEVQENVATVLAMTGRTDIPIAVNGLTFPRARRRVAIQSYKRGYRSFLGPFQKSTRPRMGPDSVPSTANEDAPGFIAHLVERHTSEIVIASLAPLTSLAAALSRHPGLSDRIRAVYAMAGHFPHPDRRGNRTDFNVWFDVAAARSFFRSGVPTVLFPLSTCWAATLDRTYLDALKSKAGLAEIFFKDLVGMLAQHGPGLPLTDQIVALELAGDLPPAAARRGDVFVRSKPRRHRGQAYFRPNPQGQVLLIDAVDPTRAKAKMLELVELMQGTTRMRKSTVTSVADDPRLRLWVRQRARDRRFAILQADPLGAADAGVVKTDADTETVLALIQEVIDLVALSKSRGDLWPTLRIARPEPLATASGPSHLGEIDRAELEAIVVDLFMKADAIAVGRDRSEGMVGCVAVSQLTEFRRQEMRRSVSATLPGDSIIVDLALVHPAHRRKHVFRHLHEALVTWCLRSHARFPSRRSAILANPADANARKAFLATGYHVFGNTTGSGLEISRPLAGYLVRQVPYPP